MRYDPVIGLEVHAQILTRSKMFCPCSADYSGAEPNTLVCPVCLGMPGVLPVINSKALEYTVMTALSLHCEIASQTKFDRKSYPYPDLMKGYQISQYDMPVSTNGWLDVTFDGQTRRAGITRVHLEEDTAKLIHRREKSGERYSLVDVNRSGVPLMEIVGEPDLRSPEEARQYLLKLRSILQYLGVSTGNMEEGSFRCDANISLRKLDGSLSENRVEIKNMNSFRAVYGALTYEVQRQSEVLDQGGRVTQETRGWVDDHGITVSQRTKENAHDYRYFPDPDLPPLVLDSDWIEGLRSLLPELPDERADRFMRDYRLVEYDALQITATKGTADYFEVAVALAPGGGRGISAWAKSLSNWVLGDLTHLLNEAGFSIEESPITPEKLVEMLNLIEIGQLSIPMGKTVLLEMFSSGDSARVIVDKRGMAQVSDTAELVRVVGEVLLANPQAVEDYRGGKLGSAKFLVGQVMRATKGQANPQIVGQIVEEHLAQL